MQRWLECAERVSARVLFDTPKTAGAPTPPESGASDDGVARARALGCCVCVQGHIESHARGSRDTHKRTHTRSNTRRTLTVDTARTHAAHARAHITSTPLSQHLRVCTHIMLACGVCATVRASVSVSSSTLPRLAKIPPGHKTQRALEYSSRKGARGCSANDCRQFHLRWNLSVSLSGLRLWSIIVFGK